MLCDIDQTCVFVVSRSRDDERKCFRNVFRWRVFFDEKRAPKKTSCALCTCANGVSWRQPVGCLRQNVIRGFTGQVPNQPTRDRRAPPPRDGQDITLIHGTHVCFRRGHTQGVREVSTQTTRHSTRTPVAEISCLLAEEEFYVVANRFPTKRHAICARIVFQYFNCSLICV